MKIGIIGCGRITEKHLAALTKLPEVEITAISDLSTERMKQAEALISSTNNELQSFIDYHQLLKTDCELVLIATASGTHFMIAEAALRAGKHVLVEKPLALSIDESRHLRTIASTQGQKLFVCHQLRFRKILFELNKLIKSGAIGMIYSGTVSMAIQRPAAYYEAAPWRGTWEQDGGMLINQGIHMIDLLVWFMGEVESVSGQLQWVNDHKETEDVASGIIRFKSGATGLIEANSVTWPENHGYAIKLFAEKGTIIFEGKNFDQVTKFTVENGPELDQINSWINEKNEQVIMYQEVMKHIDGTVNQAVTAEEAEHALETIFALYQSHKLTEQVHLPLVSFSTIDMKGVN